MLFSHGRQPVELDTVLVSFDAYLSAAKQFTAAWTKLLDPETAAEEIDRVLTTCITKARPSISCFLLT